MMSGESEEDVITQVQNVEPEDPVAMTDQSDHGVSFANETTEHATAETNAVSSASCSAGANKEEDDMSSSGNDMENNSDDELENSPVEQALASADETPAFGDSGHPPADDACDDAENTDPGSISFPPSDAISQQESEISISQLVGRGRARDKSQQSMQAKLQEAIDKVEQLDRNLEKKLKENLEAKAVTADLRALVRRELAELSGARGGRHATREETDNTMQFLRVLVDNDSESETSSLVTPIFQTQVRFGREGPHRSAEDVHPGTQPDHEHPTGDPGAGEMPPPPLPGEQQPYAGHHRPGHDQYFIRRNIELAQEAGGSLAMTEEERYRLEQLLAEDDDRLENAFSIDEQHRQMLLSLDDRLSSLGASASAPGGSSSLVSGPAGGGGDGSGGGQAADGPAHAAASEQDYLEATRHDRETSARLESLHRRLERLAEPVEVRPLDRCDVDSMIQETITSLMSAPCGGRSDITGAAASASLISVPSQTSTTVTGSEGTVGAPSSDGLPGAPSSIGTGTVGGGGGGPGSEAPTEATLDVRSVLSGTRLDENERQLASELRPGSPSAWLVDVTQGQQRLQLVVPRLSRQLIASLLESGTVLPPDQGDTAGLSAAAAAVPTAALSPCPRPVSTGAE